MNNQSPIYCENGLQYTLNEEGAFIYRYEGDDEKLVIPDTLGGKPVIGLLARSLANTKATPNPYIREIDYKSINRLKLKEIVLPETLQIIEEEAFGGLGALEKLVIPDTVISIHGYSFRGCHALKHIRLPKQIRGIGAYSFYNCLQLEEVIIPDGITYVGSCAFENCRSLTSVVIPSRVTTIEDYLFAGCTRLKAVYIPASATSISKYSFMTVIKNDNYGFDKNFTVVTKKGSAADKAAKKNVKVSYATLSAKKATLKAGGTKALTLSGATASSWLSQTTSVARIKDGTVTGLRKGTAVVGAKLANGAVVTCNITVSNNPSLKINGAAFDASKTYAVKKGSSLSVSISGKAASVNNSYSTTDKNVAAVTSGRAASKVSIAGFKAGSAIVTIKVNGVAFKVKVKVK